MLRALLIEGFAHFVLLIGHGADVVNNPYASALNCGACGGYAGDINARLLANLLNERAVREALAANDIHIPTDTIFLSGLHDTTPDKITVFEGELAVEADAAVLKKIRYWLAS